MRTEIRMMDHWQFTGPDGKEQEVTLPHTWNARDGQEGGNDYVRTTCFYRTTFPKPNFDPQTQRVYLEFQGVNSSAAVTVNGQQVMIHHGGYSTFRTDITDILTGENHLQVAVDNTPNRTVYPQKADFTFYGGIYRDVLLNIVSRDHFDLDYFGGEGIKVTSTADGRAGKVRVETFHNAPEGTVQVTLLDQEGNPVAQGEGQDLTLTIPNVRRWDGVKDPYLYTAVATLVTGGQARDQVQARFGVRTFHFDPNKGFFLNGRAYPLRGVSRHQDWKGIGNAITREHHDRDMGLIREIGANTIRLAHYQHDPYFYDLCDQYGMVVWAEPPYISEHMPEGRENTLSQMRELIVQNYNHPCIVTWGLSNEITISTKDTQDMLQNHAQLNDLCHKLDATRPTTLACYAMCNPFSKVVHISDIVAYNLYLGWYVPGLFLNDCFLKFFHRKWPNRCLGYSEYGAEGMPNLHSANPRRGDHTEEYQAIYHEYLLDCFARHPFLWGTYVWNMFDFAADARDQGGEPGMNHKGLITFDRQTKKDSFFLYKAYWSREPFVHICSKRFADRTGKELNVKVYTNQTSVTLYANGQRVGAQLGDHKVFEFRLPFHGETEIRAEAGGQTDTALFRKVDTPNPSYTLKKGKGKSANWV